MIDLGRLPVIRTFFRCKPSKNFLMALWDETNRNLERYYVVEQRQFITEAFDIEAWDEARIFSGINFSQELLSYSSAIRDFNTALKDMKDYEEIYSSSIEKKTRENALVLHSKKEALEEKFQKMRPIIVSAQKCLRDLLQRHRVYKV